MFKSLFSKSEPKDTGPDVPADQWAMAVLMVKIARADHAYSGSETDVIDHVLSDRFALTDDQATTLRTQAEAAEAEAVDLQRFTKMIKESTALEDRNAVLADLWRVALADGDRDAAENTVMRLISNFLGINDRDSAFARQSVQTP